MYVNTPLGVCTQLIYTVYPIQMTIPMRPLRTIYMCLPFTAHDEVDLKSNWQTK